MSLMYVYNYGREGNEVWRCGDIAGGRSFGVFFISFGWSDLCSMISSLFAFTLILHSYVVDAWYEGAPSPGSL